MLPTLTVYRVTAHSASIPSMPLNAVRSRSPASIDDSGSPEASPASSASRHGLSQLLLSDRRVDDDPDEPLDSDHDDEQSPSKRQRTDASAEFEFLPALGRIAHPLVSHDPTTFAQGAVVRVSLVNFVTYDRCSFFPGPRLNLIIGPNGTGKSTIVCALALGLGGAPSLLGRAKEVSEFVKHGQSSASIEIELYRRNQGNLRIKRTIKRASNVSIWKINGETKTLKEVLSAIRKLSIQVDNLCQFLPQDKVVEFAQLTPSELLRETQRASGEAQLGVWHETLVQLRNQERELSGQIKSDSDAKAQLEKRNSTIGREVERFHERESILKRLHLYQSKLPFVRYANAKDAYQRAKDDKKQARQAYDEIKALQEPWLQKETEVREKKAAQDADIQRASLMQRESERRLKQIDSEIQRLEGKSDIVRDDISNLRLKRAKQRDDLAAAKRQVQKLMSSMPAEPPQANTSHLEPQILEAHTVMYQASTEMNALQVKQTDLKTLHQRAHIEYQQAKARLEQMNQTRNLRLNALRRHDDATYKAILWLRNQDPSRFRDKICEPVGMEINVKDRRFAAAVENCIPRRTMRTFLVTNDDDYNFLTRELIDNQHMRINIARPDVQSVDDIPRHVSRDQVGRLGFDALLIDIVEAPDIVLAYLCEMHKFHLTPIAINAVDNNAVEASNLVENYIAQGFAFSTRTSRYGKKVTMSTSRKIAPSNILADSVNEVEVQQAKDEITMGEQNIAAISAEARTLAEDQSTTKLKFDELKAKWVSLEHAKTLIRNTVKEYERSRLRLGDFEQKVAALEMPLSIEDEENSKKAELVVIAKRRQEAAVAYKERVGDILSTFTERLEYQLHMAELDTEIAKLETKNREHSERLLTAQRALQQTESMLRSTKVAALQILDEANKIKDAMPVEEYDEMLALTQGKTEEQLEECIASDQAQADLSFATNPQVIEDYTRRLAKIGELEKALETKQGELDRITSRMNDIRGQWEPRLDHLIEHISEHFIKSFDTIGCVGEVKLDKQEEYESWGIVIYVKFRDSERLQPLTGHRQSGGERSVSTIVYLMALQELAKTPFRVVDEINQGMDPRNERMVHRQLVSVACRPNTPQYFLITPKLLPNLAYHAGMKVLCIFNGEYIPEQENELGWATG